MVQPAAAARPGMASRSASLPSSKFSVGTHKLSSMISVVSEKLCSCGTAFIADSLFCRKCGQQRRSAVPAAPEKEQPRDVYSPESHSRRTRTNYSSQREQQRPSEADLRGSWGEPREPLQIEIPRDRDQPRELRSSDHLSSATLAEALHRKTAELSGCRSELNAVRSELMGATSKAERLAQESPKHEASVKGLKEQVRMWEQEALELRGRLANVEAEKHRQVAHLEGEATRLRMARDDARRQAEQLHAECTDRLARSRAEVEETLQHLERERKEKDEQLQKQRRELNDRFDEQLGKQRRELTDRFEENTREATQEREADEKESRAKYEALTSKHREVELELVKLRGAKVAADAKLAGLAETHFAAERQSAKLLAASETQIISQRDQLRDRENMVSNLTSEIVDKTQELEDQEQVAKKRLQRLQQSAEKMEKQVLEEANGELHRAEMLRRSLLLSEAGLQTRVAEELQAARREEASMATSVFSMKEELAKSPEVQEARWAECPESPLMPASPPHAATPPSCPPAEAPRWPMPIPERRCSCGSSIAADATFCGRPDCSRFRPPEDSLLHPQDVSPMPSPTRSPGSSLWNSLALRSPMASPSRTATSLNDSRWEDLENGRDDSQKKVSFLDRRQRGEQLEEQLASANLEHSTDLFVIREERLAAARGPEAGRENEAPAADSSHQRGYHLLEDRLERTERERDRLIEATNELRSDLRIATSTSSPHRSAAATQPRPAPLASTTPERSPARGTSAEKPGGSGALRALQSRYSHNGNSPRSSPQSKRESEKKTPGFDRCVCGSVLVADAAFCQMCGARRGRP